MSLRGFDTVAGMNETMIRKWNEVVSPGDVVYHLGDFAFPNKGDGMEVEEILNKLNGQIFLVLGNHDDKNREIFGTWKHFVKVAHLHYMKFDSGQKVMLCHYPMLTWRASCHGSWHLHGHSHGNPLPVAGMRLDVGVDPHGFYPLDQYYIADLMKKKKDNIDLV